MVRWRRAQFAPAPLASARRAGSPAPTRRQRTALPVLFLVPPVRGSSKTPWRASKRAPTCRYANRHAKPRNSRGKSEICPKTGVEMSLDPHAQLCVEIVFQPAALPSQLEPRRAAHGNGESRGHAAKRAPPRHQSSPSRAGRRRSRARETMARATAIPRAGAPFREHPPSRQASTLVAAARNARCPPASGRACRGAAFHGGALR